MVEIFSDMYASLSVTLAFILCTFTVVEHFALTFCGFGFLFTFVNGHTCFCFIHACSMLFILVICGVACAPDQCNEMCLFMYLFFFIVFSKDCFGDVVWCLQANVRGNL